MNVLIVGGSSGLGLELGILFCQMKASVYVTGRKIVEVPEGMICVVLNISDDIDMLRHDLDKTLEKVPHIDVLIYAAGFLEKGHISELSDNHIIQMIHVGMTTPALLLQRIINKQHSLGGFIAITSTSQWIPRTHEPVYAGVKAGLAMLAQSVSFDPAVHKTLVVGPTGMQTKFWESSNKDTSGLLSPQIVANQIVQLWEEKYVFRLTRILREPIPDEERVQILETRFE